MSFLFSSGMLQASHSSQAYMIQWQLIQPLVQIYCLHPNIIYAASKDRLITLLNQAGRHL